MLKLRTRSTGELKRRRDQHVMHDTRRELARSLDAEELLLPFVPVLLRDLWSLGFSRQSALALLARDTLPANARVLDLGCGKGALLICAAKRLGWTCRGVDIVPEFITAARR